jgi:cell division protein FtsW
MSAHAIKASTVAVTIDQALIVLVVALAMIGFIAMSSASMEYAFEHYGDPFYHVIRHAIYLVMATVVGIVSYKFPLAVLERHGWMLLPAGLALLILVLIPGIGKEVNGSQRWIGVGPLTLQVSELAKLFVVIYIAGYLVRREHEVRRQWSGFLKPMFMMAVFIALLLAEPDFGAAVVMMGAVMVMIFLGGVRLSQFMALLVVCTGSAYLMVITSPYRMRRMTAFTDPWADQFNSGYQLVQSLIAFGRGEIFGVGLGNSIQKLFYLPEAHTDFVYAILAEEWGAFGAIVVIGLFAALIGRILIVARKAEIVGQRFGAYIAYGIAVLIAGQVFINIGVNTGLLPTKGLTLPLFSYGGSSLLVCFAMFALVLRIDMERQQLQAMPAKKKTGKNKAKEAARE